MSPALARPPVDTDDPARLRVTDTPRDQATELVADSITDERAGRRLPRAIQGRGVFRRFKDVLHEEYPHLLPAWYAFRDVRARRRAVEWLADNSLIDDDTANRFLTDHPDPDLP